MLKLVLLISCVSIFFIKPSFAEFDFKTRLAQSYLIECENLLLLDIKKLRLESFVRLDPKISKADFQSFIAQYPDAEIQYFTLGGLGLILKVKPPGKKAFLAKFPWESARFHGLNAFKAYKNLEKNPNFSSRSAMVFNADKAEFPIQMELIQGPSLYNFLEQVHEKKETLSFPVLHFLMQEMALAVDRFHQRNVISRDIKPDNFIVEKYGNKIVGVRLIDLDLVKEIGEIQTVAGSPGFIDPILELSGGMEPLTFSNDLYSLKVTYQILLLAKVMNSNLNQFESPSFTYKKSFLEKSPYSYDPTIPEVLSVIAFHHFDYTPDLLDALEKAKTAYETKDNQAFYGWFYKKHLKHLPPLSRNAILDKSLELKKALF